MTKTKLKQPYELTDEEAKKFCLNHWESEMIDDSNYSATYDMYVYEETTADGYSVYVTQHGEDARISICEDVYYYNDDLEEAIIDLLRQGYVTVKICSSLEEDLHISWHEYYSNIYDELINNDEEE
jgi:hypothetical protein